MAVIMANCYVCRSIDNIIHYWPSLGPGFCWTSPDDSRRWEIITTSSRTRARLFRREDEDSRDEDRLSDQTEGSPESGPANKFNEDGNRKAREQDRLQLKSPILARHSSVEIITTIDMLRSSTRQRSDTMGCGVCQKCTKGRFTISLVVWGRD